MCVMSPCPHSDRGAAMILFLFELMRLSSCLRVVGMRMVQAVLLVPWRPLLRAHDDAVQPAEPLCDRWRVGALRHRQSQRA